MDIMKYIKTINRVERKNLPDKASNNNAARLNCKSFVDSRMSDFYSQKNKNKLKNNKTYTENNEFQTVSNE